MTSRTLSAEAELDLLQDEAVSYFLHETNPVNGLVIDKTAANWPASIAATGLALAAYPVAVEHGLMPRAAAVERTLTTLRFFSNSPQGPQPDSTGYQGFFIIFSIGRPADAPGNANCRQLIVRCCGRPH